MIFAPTLETERLMLRGPLPRDFAALRDFYSSKRSEIIGGPKSFWFCARVFLGARLSWVFQRFGIWYFEEKTTRKTVGLIGATKVRGYKDPVMVYVVFNGFERKGFGTEAIRKACGFLLAQKGISTLRFFISPRNQISSTVISQLGASLVRETTVRGFFTHEYSLAAASVENEKTSVKVTI